MFSFFKSNPSKKLRKQHDEKLEDAMNAQRNGDIQGYAMLTKEAEEIWAKIEELEKQQA
ncbi:MULTISPECIES: DUF6435 family protein [Neptunomonas]|jgi:hypothetical protein|uniref:DUF6435 family protein n=1 Tax=Neptunomonas TaxID=75687 RepID=UPI000A8EF04F|nr:MULTISPECIES: DUF6435 family protein [Neptunomonas]MBT3146978.1 Lacal_2735 family protein [Neptunomonas phycophila]MDN2658668.1 DUF6435 family protein [Neptunomonas sp. CHC150]MDO6467577.1 DUF6435 family protein [Neptunomonas phycophila]QLE98413.1 Lacal_2735 family protein [Neptunomonas phycophila]